MAGQRSQIPTLDEFQRSPTLGKVILPTPPPVPLPMPVPRPSMAEAEDQGPSDLVSYIIQNLPAWSEVTRTQIWAALGIAVLGLGGAVGLYAGLQASRREAKDEEPEPGTPEPCYVTKRKKSVTYAPYTGVQAELKRRQSIGQGPPRPWPTEVLILHQCPRGRKTPCIAPYPLKLETFLRVNGINYEVDFGAEEPRKAESPWITLGQEDIADTKNCILFLCEKYSLNPQKHLNKKERSLERACHHLLENHMYWGISLYRWVYDGARSLDKIQYLPANSAISIPDVCRTVEQAAWYHGIGKKSPDDVVAEILRDLSSLSRILGEKKFFLSNESPTELDCTAFSMLAQMLWNMDGSPYHVGVTETYKNLGEFCWRIREAYWPDWDKCLHNEYQDALMNLNNNNTLD